MADLQPEPQLQDHDNATIRKMREALTEKDRAMRAEIEERDKRIAEFEAQQKQAERMRLDELDRLKAEKQELEAKVADEDKLRNELGQYQSKFESLYNAALQTAPEDKREALADLTSSGSFADRYDALMKAKALIGVAAPVVAGTPAQPAPVIQPREGQKPFDPKNPPAWGFKD